MVGLGSIRKDVFPTWRVRPSMPINSKVTAADVSYDVPMLLIKLMAPYLETDGCVSSCHPKNNSAYLYYTRSALRSQQSHGCSLNREYAGPRAFSPHQWGTSGLARS